MVHFSSRLAVAEAKYPEPEHLNPKRTLGRKIFVLRRYFVTTTCSC